MMMMEALTAYGPPNDTVSEPKSRSGKVRSAPQSQLSYTLHPTPFRLGLCVLTCMQDNRRARRGFHWPLGMCWYLQIV